MPHQPLLVRRLRAASSRIRDLAKRLSARPHPNPVIVVGKEKSGTTAIAALLAKATAQSAQLDIPEIWGQTEMLLHQGELSYEEVVARYPHRFASPILKEPGFTWSFDSLRAAFPQARFVMVVREPADNIRSVLNRVGLPGDLSDITKSDIERLPTGWNTVLDSTWLSIEGGTYIEQAAQRWAAAAEVYLSHRDAFHLVRYEDFRHSKLDSIHRLADDLGMAVINDIVQDVDRQFQPRGDSAVDLPQFFGGTNHEIIQRITQRERATLGYA